MKQKSILTVSRIVISVCIGVAVGFAIGSLQRKSMTYQRPDSAQGLPVSSVECVCDIQRVREIEAALRVEHETNQLLVAEIDELKTEIEQLTSLASEARLRAPESLLENAGEESVADQLPAHPR